MREKFGLLLLTYVALRKESVDRNSTGPVSLMVIIVALRKESVDRNSGIASSRAETAKSRSPQGERG